MNPTYPTLDQIVAAVCATSGVPYDVIVGHDRDARIIAARRAIVYLARRLPRVQPSYPQISEKVRLRAKAHATVIDNDRFAVGAVDAVIPTERQAMTLRAIRAALAVLSEPTGGSAKQ